MFIIMEYQNLYLVYFIIMICFILFFLTLYSIIIFSQNFIYVFLLNEILIFILIMQFMVTGYMYDSMECQLFILILLIVSSCEIVVGLSLVVSSQRLFSSKGSDKRSLHVKIANRCS